MDRVDSDRPAVSVAVLPHWINRESFLATSAFSGLIRPATPFSMGKSCPRRQIRMSLPKYKIKSAVETANHTLADKSCAYLNISQSGGGVSGAR
jgi:hypothetical protein